MQREKIMCIRNNYTSYMQCVNENFYMDTVKISNLKVNELTRIIDDDVKIVKLKLSNYFIRVQILVQVELFMLTDDITHLKTIHELHDGIRYFLYEKTENEVLFDKLYNDLYNQFKGYVMSDFGKHDTRYCRIIT